MGLLARILGVDNAPRSRLGPSPESARIAPPRDAPFEVRVEAVLDQVRPALQSDGGDVELVEVVGKSANVRLVGACRGCPSAALTLRFGIEKRLREEIPEFQDLIPV